MICPRCGRDDCRCNRGLPGDSPKNTTTAPAQQRDDTSIFVEFLRGLYQAEGAVAPSRPGPGAASVGLAPSLQVGNGNVDTVGLSPAQHSLLERAASQLPEPELPELPEPEQQAPQARQARLKARP